MATGKQGFKRNSQFQPGSGTYTCGICGITTRETGSGESGCELCVDCFELAGMDNHCNDNGVSPVQAGYALEIDERLANIARKGGNVEKVKAMNTYLFPRDHRHTHDLDDAGRCRACGEYVR